MSVQEPLATRPRRARWAICLAVAGVAVPARAATRFWVGNGVGNWSGGLNWELIGGGSGAPVAGDDVFITQADLADRTVLFDANFPVPNALASLYVDAAGLGTIQLNQAANRLRGTAVYVGDAGYGLVHQTGGVHDAGTLYLGYGIGSDGRYNVSNSAALNIATAMYVGYAGTGTVNQSGGAVSVTNGAELLVAYLAGGQGTYNLSGGTLTTPALRIADDTSTVGQFIHSAGTAVVAGKLQIASFAASSSGSYTLTGGRLVVGGTLVVGDRGVGVFDHSGGTVQLTGGGTNGLVVSMTAPSGAGLGSIGTYLLGGSGVLSVTGRVQVGIGGDGAFTQSGGSHLINGSLVIAASTGTNVAVADYDLQGGTLAVNGVIQLNAGGTFTRTGGAMSFTTFTMDGGLVAGTLPNSGTFNYNAGTFSGRLVNTVAAAVTLNADFVAGNGMDNAAVLVFGSNRTVTLNGAGLNNTGTMLLQGAVLNGSGPLVNSGSLGGNGEIGGTGGFTNGGAWTVSGGAYRLTNTGPLLNAGSATVAASASLIVDSAAARLDNTGTMTLHAGSTVAGPGGLDNKAAGVISAADATIGAAFTNRGTVNIGIGGVGSLAVPGAFVNSGSIVMTGTAGLLSGGMITNTGTVSGRGQITNAVQNGGTISQTLPGDLALTGAVQNLAGGTITVAGSGAFLIANLAANSGTINVNAGGTFSAGSFANAGRINVAGTLDIGGVTNTGTIAFGGTGVTDVFGPINNAAGGSIAVGGGTPSVLIYDLLTHGAGASLSVSAGAALHLLGNVSGGGAVTNNGAIHFGAGASYGLGAFTGTGDAVLFEGAQLTATRIVQGSLTLNASGTVGASVAIVPAVTPASVTSKVSTLTIAGGATPQARLDLTNTNLVIDYAGASPQLDVRALLRAGYNAGGTLWAGNGVVSSVATSSTGLGYGEASQVLGLFGGTATWKGETVDATSLLVRYTLWGDATLDGVVDFNDLVVVAQNYNIADGTRVWTTADFNYDGNADFIDLVRLAQNYNAALPADGVAGMPVEFQADWARAVASVPEPGVGAVVLSAVWGLRRRRR